MQREEEEEEEEATEERESRMGEAWLSIHHSALSEAIKFADDNFDDVRLNISEVSTFAIMVSGASFSSHSPHQTPLGLYLDSPFILALPWYTPRTSQ